MSKLWLLLSVLALAAPARGDGELKPLPTGIYASIGGLRTPADDPVRSIRLSAVVRGVILGVPWDLCGDDEACLFDAIRRALDSAGGRGLQLALAVSDGGSVPPAVAAACRTFAFEFRGSPRRMCLAWDPAYLGAKAGFVRRLGEAFDDHPALAYAYFTGACSTNGNEGHCRVDSAGYTAEGYTRERLAGAYLTVMAAYREAFPRTPLAFEVHALFDSAFVWERVWEDVRASARVGVAAWWCAERLSLRGRDTVPVWPLVQEAAATSFAVCQTVASFAKEPYSFSDAMLGLDYGTADAWSPEDSLRALSDTLDWAQGRASHAGQARIHRFSVLEAWWSDVLEPRFEERLRGF